MTESDVRHLEQCVIEAFRRVLKKRKIDIPLAQKSRLLTLSMILSTLMALLRISLFLVRKTSSSQTI